MLKLHLACTVGTNNKRRQRSEIIFGFLYCDLWTFILWILCFIQRAIKNLLLEIQFRHIQLCLSKNFHGIRNICVNLLLREKVIFTRVILITKIILAKVFMWSLSDYADCSWVCLLPIHPRSLAEVRRGLECWWNSTGCNVHHRYWCFCSSLFK